MTPPHARRAHDASCPAHTPPESLVVTSRGVWGSTELGELGRVWVRRYGRRRGRDEVLTAVSLVPLYTPPTPGHLIHLLYTRVIMYRCHGRAKGHTGTQVEEGMHCQVEEVLG